MNKIAAALLFAALCSARSARAEDPFLGRIKAIKCVGCRPGWVDIVVHDPIDVRDFEIAVKDVDYYKVVSPLPGKDIHDKDGACFYWFDAPKGGSPAKAKPKPTGGGPSAAGGPSAIPPAPKPVLDSAGTDSSVTAIDTTLVPPPALPEPEGPPPVPSKCIPYVHQTPAPPAPSKDK